MKKWRTGYRQNYRSSPISFWVHKHLSNDSWCRSIHYEPPLPKAIPCKGYPFLIINAFGIELTFASVIEAEHFLEVIAQKNMPTTRELSRKRCNHYGPNTHWLSRLPARINHGLKGKK